MIKIEFPITLPDNLQEEFNKLIKTYMNIALKNIAGHIESYAKLHHRYRNDTNNLTNSIKSSITINDGEYSVDIYVDEGEAPYAKHIVDGHRSWSPDRFLDKALTDNESYVYTQIEIAFDNAITEFNQG